MMAAAQGPCLRTGRTAHRLPDGQLGVGLTATALICTGEIYTEVPAALASALSLLLITRQRVIGFADALALTAHMTALFGRGI